TTCWSARLAPLTAPRMPRSEASARMRTPSPTGPAKPTGAPVARVTVSSSASATGSPPSAACSFVSETSWSPRTRTATVAAPRVLDVGMERVRVLHDELAPAHEAEARPDLVPELHLDLVEVLREIAVGADLSPDEIGHHLLVGRAEAEVAVVAVLEPQELAPVLLPAAALPPELGRDDRRHQDLLRAGAVH